MHYVNSCTMWGDPQSIFGTLQLVLNWRISKGPKQCYRKIVHKTIKIHAKKSFLAKYAWASLFKKFKTHLFICCFVILCSHVFPPLWVCGCGCCAYVWETELRKYSFTDCFIYYVTMSVCATEHMLEISFPLCHWLLMNRHLNIWPQYQC